MLKQRPTLDITYSILSQVWAQVHKITSHLIQYPRENIAELYDVHRFESDAERLEIINSHLAHNKYLYCVVECVEGGVYSPNPMHRGLKATDE